MVFWRCDRKKSHLPPFLRETSDLKHESKTRCSVLVFIYLLNSFLFPPVSRWRFHDLDGKLVCTRKEDQVMPTHENTPDLSTMDGDELAEYLIDHPEFADQCDLDKLDGSDWSRLLTFQPSFASRCDWEKLDGWDWSDLLEEQPHFAYQDVPWELFHPIAWSSLLSKQPQFADHCDEWENLDGKWWSLLLISQPQFADKCDWSKLGDADWDELLKYQPHFSDKRPKA